jgi:hypothetical protein
MPIRTYPNKRSAFDPDAIDAMSKALEEPARPSKSTAFG